jgi:hypothetical protein
VSWSPRSRGCSPAVIVGFSPDLGDGTTRIDHELELDAQGIFRLMQPLLRANGKKTVRVTAAALARHLEDDPPNVGTR